MPYMLIVHQRKRRGVKVRVEMDVQCEDEVTNQSQGQSFRRVASSHSMVRAL